MQSGLSKRIFRALLVVAMAAFLLPGAKEVWANAQVRKATAHYLKGNSFLSAKKYGKAAASFRRAYSLLPRHPHFNCHRAQFLNYMARAYEKLGRPRTAMQSYYTAAYRAGCKTAATKNYAARRYRYLYNRWMCSISFATTPPKARVYIISSSGDKLIGRTPYKKVFAPGKYQFKIRLYDHRTIYYKVKLQPGRHLKRNFKMVKGDDPITRVEKVDIAPPVPLASLRKKAAGSKKAAAPKDPNKVDLGTFKGTGGSGLDTRTAKAGSGDITNITRKRKIVRPGPPVYKQAWFWAVIGGVVVAAVVIPIVVPKEQKALVSQGKMF